MILSTVKNEFSDTLGEPDKKLMICSSSIKKIILSVPKSFEGLTVEAVFTPA